MSVSTNNSEKSIRTFIAIELPLPLREELSQVGIDLGIDLPKRAIRWVKPANIHLTLRFIGNMPVDKVAELSQEMDLKTSKLQPFMLRLGKLGCFPNQRRPRIIWIGLEGDTNQLMKLHQMVESAVENLGWKREKRRFHPHLSIGRVKESRLIARSNIPYNQELLNRSFLVDSVYLVRSVLEPMGAVYSHLYRSKLGNS